MDRYELISADSLIGIDHNHMKLRLFQGPVRVAMDHCGDVENNAHCGHLFRQAKSTIGRRGANYPEP